MQTSIFSSEELPVSRSPSPDSAAVLFERESLSGHPAPRRETGEAVAGGAVAGAVSSKWSKGTGGPAGDECYNLTIAHALRADGFDASEDGTGRGTPIVPTIAPCLTGNYGKQPDSSDTSAGPMLIPYTLAIRGRGDSHDLEYRQDGTANAILTPNGGRGGIGVGAIAFSAKDHGADAGDIAPTLRADGFTNSHANGGCMPAVAFGISNQPTPKFGIDIAPSLDAKSSGGGRMEAVAFAGQGYPAIRNDMQVRRLTPRECERLQGFPDDYTLIPYNGKLAADGPRYKALGNSMATNVMAWIGRRIALLEQLITEGLV
jgi:DNA (cytosine-5)-methyltransferase 1